MVFRADGFGTMPKQLPLKGLCLLVLCCGCGGYGESEYEQVKRRENDFADKVLMAGGSATLEGKAMFGMTGKGWLIDLSGGIISDELIEAMIAAREKDPIFQLDLRGSTITDDQLVRLDQGKVLQQTIKLDLSETAITDAGLDRLQNHYIIAELNIKDSQITEDAARRLGERQINNPQTPGPFKKQPKLDI